MLTSQNSEISFRKALQGAIAGFIATAPMSLTMVLGWRLLPRREQYHLPPRMITEELSERVGLEDDLTEGQLAGVTIASHFGYGAAFGALYALFGNRLRMHSSLRGALMGLGVWTGSYLGWLPAMGILSPATRHPWRRNLMMIVAHIVWGVTLGEITRKLAEKE